MKYVDIRMATCQTNGSDMAVRNFRVRTNLSKFCIFEIVYAVLMPFKI